MGERIEHRVDHARRVVLEERLGDVDIFADHHARRHVRAVGQLEGAGAQDGAQRRVDAGQRPAGRQRAVDRRVERLLVAHDAGDNVAEEGGVGVAILVAVDLLAEPVGLELGDHLGQRRAAEVHLVERLHGGEPGRAALVGRPLGAMAGFG